MNMITTIKNPKKGQRTARLILPNGCPFIQIYSDQYRYFQYYNNQNNFCKKTKFEKSIYEKDNEHEKSNNELLTYDHNSSNKTSYNSNTSSNINLNIIKSEESLPIEKNDFKITSSSLPETLQIDHIPKFFEIRGKGPLPTIYFVKGKIILS